MPSPHARHVGFESNRYLTESVHTNWEGLLTALGISAIGWATVALVVMRLVR
jgi:hypothetical protein